MKNIKLRKLTALCTAITLSALTFSSCGSGESYESSNGGNGKSANTNTQQNDITTRYNYTNDAETTDETMMGNETYDTDCVPEENNEEYNSTTENPFTKVTDAPLSTFSTDVDTASYTNVRRMIENGEDIDADAVRTEEFINYFKYDYQYPENDDAVAITTQLSDCPWNSESKLMLVGLQAEEVETQNIDSNIVFLIDVSGSMSDENKLPLVQSAFTMLSENLGENDRISIVTYAGSDEIVLEGESGANFDKISSSINSLTAGGSTAGADGINTAYNLASEYFIEGGNNRVILATDGDLNVGLSSEEELTSLIEQKRDSGVFLSVLGFGSGNLKDDRLEALADNGNGNYAYIDSEDEAERVLVSEMNGTLYTVAKDVKIQVEFNPTNVSQYRLVGYENRLLDDEDFEDDTKDAGDIGSGQQVTALYEIIPASNSTFSDGKDLKYQLDSSEEKSNDTTGLDKEMLTVSLRYKDPDDDQSKLIDATVKNSDYTNKAPTALDLSSHIAEFSMYLRNSEYLSDDVSPVDIYSYLNENGIGDKNDEFFNLLKMYISNYSSSYRYDSLDT